MTGRLPFSGTTTGNYIAGILEGRPEPLGKPGAAVPARLERIVRRAVSKNREARYVNAAELMKELQDAREEIGTSRRRRFPKRRLIFVAALLAGIACAVPAAHYIRTAIPGPSGRRAVPASDAIHSLAVLPFANDGAAAASDYLVDGITDTLIDDLSQIQQLKLASHNAVARYEGAAGDVRAAARALGVRAVLTGRVAQKGQNIAVTLDLAFGISRDGGWRLADHAPQGPCVFHLEDSN